LSASSFDALSLVGSFVTYIVSRTALQIWQVSDSITVSTNTHPIRTLTWVVSTSWADAANGPLARVNIYDIITKHCHYAFSVPYAVYLCGLSSQEETVV
jgi:hypothetical protein